ncbi:MAG: hypothetical protein ACM3JB_05995 [Acidobacteriaceae bacterium]
MRSEATKLGSIAAEAELFSKLVAENRAAESYTQNHPQYLQKQASKELNQLSDQRAQPEVQDALARLQDACERLNRVLSELPKKSGDPRWNESAREFYEIHHAVERLRREL